MFRLPQGQPTLSGGNNDALGAGYPLVSWVTIGTHIWDDWDAMLVKCVSHCSIRVRTDGANGWSDFSMHVLELRRRGRSAARNRPSSGWQDDARIGRSVAGALQPGRMLVV